MNTEDVDLIHL